LRSSRQIYYNLFSRVYDTIIRLHSRDREGSLRRFITDRTRVSEGDRALDLCTGTGSVAVELAKRAGKAGLVGTKQFLRNEESIFGKEFTNLAKEMSPTGQSKLISGEKRGG